MKLKVINALVLALFLIGMLTLAFNIQPVKAETGTIYIRADGSIDPPTAPIQRDGDIYTFTENITGWSVLVQRDNIVIDGNGYALKGPSGESYGIGFGYIVNVTVRNTIIANFPFDGLAIGGNSHKILNNTITNNGGSYVWGYYKYGGITLSANNSLVQGNNITFNQNYGIKGYINNNTIQGNHITDNWGDWTTYGIILYDVSEYHIIGNVISRNRDAGIVVYGSANVIEGNMVANNGAEGIGIRYGSSNVISGNIVTDHYGCGIELFYSNNNMLLRNKIEKNSVYVGRYFAGGIRLIGSKNTINDNDITNNYQIGINVLEDSANNTIYHNNFINNPEQVFLEKSLPNVWDDGYPSGGNYWSNYTGVDLYSGPNQDYLGGDSIGDAPYVIDSNNTDRYPLMNPWEVPTPVTTYVRLVIWEGIEYYIVTESNSSIFSHLNFTRDIKEISFSVAGPEGTIGFCNVTIPKQLLYGDPWTVLIDGLPVDFTQTENATHSMLYFTYTHSTHKVRIIGQPLPPVVGGNIVPVNKLELLMPYIGVASIILITATAIVIKKREY